MREACSDMGVRSYRRCGKDGCFLGSRQDLPRFLGSLDHPSSNHGEGDEEGGGPRPHEGDAARDEGHEVSWDLIPVVRSGSRVLCAGSSVWVESLESASALVERVESFSGEWGRKIC